MLCFTSSTPVLSTVGSFAPSLQLDDEAADTSKSSSPGRETFKAADTDDPFSLRILSSKFCCSSLSFVFVCLLPFRIRTSAGEVAVEVKMEDDAFASSFLPDVVAVHGEQFVNDDVAFVDSVFKASTDSNVLLLFFDLKLPFCTEDQVSAAGVFAIKADDFCLLLAFSSPPLHHVTVVLCGDAFPDSCALISLYECCWTWVPLE